MRPVANFFRSLLGLDNSAKTLPEEKLPETQNPTPTTLQPPAPTTSPFFHGEDNDLFTDLGLQTAIEYYNQKYPERGQIHYIREEFQRRGFNQGY
jgi:hypothetical protein